MSENTTLGSDPHFAGGPYQGHEVEPGRTTDHSQQMLAASYDQPQEGSEAGPQGNALNQFVTKVPQADAGPADGENSQ